MTAIAATRYRQFAAGHSTYKSQKAESRRQKSRPTTSACCLLTSSFKEVLRQHHRAALHFVFRRFDLTAKIGVVGDINRFAEREVLIVGNQDRDRPSIAREDRSFSADLALSDELTHVGGQIEELQSLFHRRTRSSSTRGTRPSGPDVATRSRRSLSDSRFSHRRRIAVRRRCNRRSRPAARVGAARR